MRNYLNFLGKVGLYPYVDEFLQTNSGLTNPYHNLAHGLRVAYCAAEGAQLGGQPYLSLAVAGLFHDWGHPGTMGNDPENIARAVEKIRGLPLWNPNVDLDIAAHAVEGTVFPAPDGFKPTPAQGILRDADFWHAAYLSEEDWLMVQAGLAREFGKTLPEWLVGNINYLRTVPTHSVWGEYIAPQFRPILVKQAEIWVERLVR